MGDPGDRTAVGSTAGRGAGHGPFPARQLPGDVALGPGSVSARVYGDVRVLAVASRALVLQVAHPVVGAGVADHSDFRADPWGRLVRTLDTVTPLVYGTPERADALGRDLRARHRGIAGTDHVGRRYTAFDPEAWAWVHATLLDAVLTASRLFGPALTPAELPRLYDEFLLAGTHLGVEPTHLPPDLASFRTWVDRMVADRLEDTPAVREVLDTLAAPVPPPGLPPAVRRAWPVAWLPVGRVLATSSVAVLPRVLRDRLGLRLGRRQRAEFAVLRHAVRTGVGALPPSARLLPQARRELRRSRAGAGSGAGA